MNMAFSDSRAFDPGDITLALRPLAWGELCARLVAAQDLRRHQVLAERGNAAGAGLPTGSFHRGAAHMLLHHERSQDFVNPTCSINSKGNAGKTVDSREPLLTARTPRQADENCHD
jgi:hypothetical protein